MNPKNEKQDGHQHPSVSLVVLAWNGRDDTLECLKSLAAVSYPRLEVVVVDNGSSDDTVRAVRESYPAVQLIENGKNLGYAGGNNVGILYALDRGADYVMLLNNDTVVHPDFLDVMLETLQANPDIGVLGARI
ncbi:MAG: glycosyltransferase family 2 protein, partial [Chloroflexi bacterium]|nr:glycosyltransferase family 2 protein [Chloroflexota bacterium]